MILLQKRLSDEMSFISEAIRQEAVNNVVELTKDKRNIEVAQCEVNGLDHIKTFIFPKVKDAIISAVCDNDSDEVCTWFNEYCRTEPTIDSTAEVLIEVLKEKS